MHRLSLLHRVAITAGAALTASLLIAATPVDAVQTAPSGPAKHYVDCSQAKSGDGSTAASAWNSLTAVDKHGAFVPGDQILLKRGTTCTGRLTLGGSGTAKAPILLGAYGSGSRPLVAGHGTPDWTGAVELRNQQYWTIQDLRITNTNGAKAVKSYRAGLLLWNDGGGRLRGVTVQRLDVRSVVSRMNDNHGDPREWGGIAAITIDRPGSNGYDGLRILHNTIVSVGRTGLMVSNHGYPRSADKKLLVSSNRIDKPRGDGLVVRGSVDARIDYNRVSAANSQWPCSDCGKISPKTANAGIWTALSKNIRIDHNEAWATKARGGDGEGFDIDASAVNVVLEYNYAHDNEAGGVLFCGSTNAIARFNILENNGRSAFAFIGTLPTKTRTQIYNNTVYSSSKTKARVVRYFNGAHSAPIVFKNNILYNFGYASYQWPTKKVSTSANTLIGLHGAGRPTDSRTSWVNPGLKNPGSGGTGLGTLKGYKPKHPSTFTRGVAIPSTVTTDFFGKKINPKRPPRGAAG